MSPEANLAKVLGADCWTQTGTLSSPGKSPGIRPSSSVSPVKDNHNGKNDTLNKTLLFLRKNKYQMWKHNLCRPVQCKLIWKDRQVCSPTIPHRLRPCHTARPAPSWWPLGTPCTPLTSSSGSVSWHRSSPGESDDLKIK